MKIKADERNYKMIFHFHMQHKKVKKKRKEVLKIKYNNSWVTQ